MNERTPEEQRIQALEHFRRYGRDDILLAGYPDYNPGYYLDDDDEVIWGTPTEELKVAYEQSRQESEQEKAANPALFYLNALLKMMDRGDEWYGSDFDEPRWVVQQVIKHITGEQG